MPIGFDEEMGPVGIAFGFGDTLDHRTEATLRAMILLLETLEVETSAPLKCYVHSSSAVYALEGQIYLPHEMQRLLDRVRELWQGCLWELNTVRSLQEWISFPAWVVAISADSTWAVAEEDSTVVWSRVSLQGQDRTIANGGSAWLPVNPTPGSR